MRVLIFGSRTYNRKVLLGGELGEEQFCPVMDAIVSAYDEAYREGLVVIHGAARGADLTADMTAEMYGVERLPFPADWDQYGKRAGPIRNQQMLDEGKPDLAFGFVDKPLPDSRGSADMATRCKRAGITTYIVEKLN